MIACKHVVYRASICKSYLTTVAMTEAEENEQKLAETALINSELETLFESNKYYQGKLDTLRLRLVELAESKRFIESEFLLGSITPENPEDIITDIQSGTSNEGFFFEYKVMTTEALMNICGSVKITLTERFREEVKARLRFF